MNQQNLILKILEDFKEENKNDLNTIIKRLDISNGNILKNTEFRIQSVAVIAFLKWAIAIIGASNIGSILYLYFSRQ